MVVEGQEQSLQPLAVFGIVVIIVLVVTLALVISIKSRLKFMRGDFEEKLNSHDCEGKNGD
jgi:hypothetical protein